MRSFTVLTIVVFSVVNSALCAPFSVHGTRQYPDSIESLLARAIHNEIVARSQFGQGVAPDATPNTVEDDDRKRFGHSHGGEKRDGNAMGSMQSMLNSMNSNGQAMAAQDMDMQLQQAISSMRNRKMMKQGRAVTDKLLPPDATAGDDVRERIECSHGCVN